MEFRLLERGFGSAFRHEAIRVETVWVREVTRIVVEGVKVYRYFIAFRNVLSVDCSTSGAYFAPKGPRRRGYKPHCFVEACSEVLTRCEEWPLLNRIEGWERGANLVSKFLVGNIITAEVDHNR